VSEAPGQLGEVRRKLDPPAEGQATEWRREFELMSLLTLFLLKQGDGAFQFAIAGQRRIGSS
jgi:hypothetical protein